MAQSPQSRYTVPKPNPVEINNEKDYQNMLQASEKMVVFVDIHEDWCGPAKALHPYFNQLWIDVDEASKRIFIGNTSIV